MILDCTPDQARKMAAELCEFHPEFRAKVAVICAAFGVALNEVRFARIRALHKIEHAARLQMIGGYVSGEQIADALLRYNFGMENALRQAGAE